MAHARPLSHPARAARPARPAAGLVTRLWALLWLGRQRRRLAQLDDHLLQDIGLTRDEALREAERPLWDAPSHWRG